MEEPTLLFILSSWSWRPAILLGLGTVAASYAYGFYHFHHHGWLTRLNARGLVKRRHPIFFTLGLLTIFLALLSAIDVFAEQLFMAHMLQHIMLIMVAPPLILLGLPSPLVRWMIQEFRLRGILQSLTSPMLAFALYNFNLLLWHIPAFYETALRNPVIHDLEHALFFYTAILFWWRVIDPTRGWFPLWQWAPAKWIYLIVAAPPSYVLGSILWANGYVLYPFYDQVVRFWNLSALADQRFGGMLMWVQGWMFMMTSVIVLFSGYDPETEQTG